MRPGTIVLAGLVILASSVPAAIADMYLVRTISLNDYFGPLGNNPMTVTSDGTYAYIGGYNGSGTAADIGILKINLFDPNDATALSNATQNVQTFRFYDGLVVHNGILYALCDRPQNTTQSTNVRAIDVATGDLVATFDGDFGNGDGIVFEPAAMSVGATGGLAFDPGYGGVDYGLSLLGYGRGRRVLLDIADGTTLYDTSTGMAVADISGACTVADQTAWRDHVYDANGNVYLRRSNQVQVALRSGPNAIGGWLHLTDELNADGTPKVGCGDGRPVAVRVAATTIGQHLELIPASSAWTDQDLIIFNDRYQGVAGQPFANVVKVITTTGDLPNPPFQLFKGDGSPLDTTVVPDSVGLYDFYYDATNDWLLILDFGNRNLLVFGPPAGPALCPGDTNCDGEITFADIDSFVEALSGEENWTHAPCPWLNADCNGDGDVTFADIDGFVALIGTSCQ